MILPNSGSEDMSKAVHLPASATKAWLWGGEGRGEGIHPLADHQPQRLAVRARLQPEDHPVGEGQLDRAQAGQADIARLDVVDAADLGDRAGQQALDGQVLHPGIQP